MGSIFVDLLMNTGKFEEGAKKSSKALKDFGNEAAEASKKAAIALTAATTAIAALTVKQLLSIDATVKASRSLGIANESYQALGTVAKEAGVDQETLTSLITKSQKSLVDASRAGTDTANAYSRLGLNTKELIALTPDQQFAKIEESLAKIENPTLRTSLALEIFGKQGLAAANIAEDFAAKLDDARKFNDKFGISVSSIDARKVEEANDSFGRLGSALGGIGNQIAIKLAPIITELSNALLNSGIDGKTAGDAISSALGAAGTVIDLIRQGVLGLRAIFIKAAEGVLELGVKFQEAGVGIAEFRDSLFSTDASKSNLADARAGLEDAKNLAGAAADEYAALEKQAEGFETTAQKVARIQDEAQKRAQDAEEKLKKQPKVAPIADVDTKRLNTLKEINAELDKQISSASIQVDLFGQSKDLIDRQVKEHEILLKLKEAGVTLSAAENDTLQKKLDLLQVNQKRLEDLNKAKTIIDDSRSALDKYNQTHAELNRLQEEGLLTQDQYNKAQEKALSDFADNDEETKKMKDAVHDLGLTFSSAFEDAVSGGKSFRDILKGVESDLLKLGTRKLLTEPIAGFFDNFFKPTPGGGSGIGSIFGKVGGLFSSLPGFATGGSFDVGGTGGVDSQLVAFKASPWETVSVNRPGQNNGGGQVIMNIQTPDANSFARSQGQIMARAQAQLQRATLRNA